MNGSDHIAKGRVWQKRRVRREASAFGPAAPQNYVPGWQLPGGGVEPGETMAEALARELMEEGNIEILEPPVLHGLFFNSRVSQRDHVALFIVRSFRQQRLPVSNREIAAHGFFSLDALPENTTPGTRARIAEVMLGAPLSERW
jgi:8-oxo-dGTP pyrophosphatase MutT (NUDIX family)